jgi:Zn-dependent membrane protease YugP
VDWEPESRKRSTYPIAHSVREIERPAVMIVLGIILLIAGFLLNISILWTIGIILLVIGVVLAILGSVGRPVGGRRHYF